MKKNTGKSGNFASPEKWEPCANLAAEEVKLIFPHFWDRSYCVVVSFSQRIQEVVGSTLNGVTTHHICRWGRLADPTWKDALSWHTERRNMSKFSGTNPLRHSISSDCALQLHIDTEQNGFSRSGLSSPRQFGLHDRASSESDLAHDPGSRPSLTVDR